MDHIEPGVAQRLHRAQRIATRRDDILDDCDSFAGGEAAFELFAGAVTLCLFAHEEQRQAGLHRHRAAEKDSAKLGRGETLRWAGHEIRQVTAHSLEQHRIGFEKKLVEVAIRAAP